MGTVAGVGLDYLGFIGKVSAREALGFPDRAHPESPEVGTRWITVFDPTADLSELDPVCMMGVRARLRPVVAKIQTKGAFRMILVASSTDSGQFIEQWQAMTGPDPTYASNPEVAVSIREACLRHGLTDEQIAATEAEIARDFRDALRF
jgi:hypothetical protein